MMTFVIISGEIDLSVASVMGARRLRAGRRSTRACRSRSSWRSWSRCSPARGAGLINGFWVAYVGLPSLAVTLAGLIGYRGVARILVEDRSIGGFPRWFNHLGQQPLIGPLTVSHLIIFVVLFVVAGDRAARLGVRPRSST